MAITTVEQLQVLITANQEQFNKEFKKVNAQLRDLEKSTNQVSDSVTKNLSPALSGLKNKISEVGKVAAVGLGVGLATVGGLALKAASSFETMKVALVTALGGSEKAAGEAMDQITKFASKTPYELNEVLDAFIKLKNYGLDPSEEALTAYGDTASALGKSLNQMIEAVADASTGEFERLKEFGIRASKEGDRVRFTFKGVTKEVGNSSEEIQKYLIELGKTNFSGGMEAQSKTLAGMMSTLKDTFNLALTDIAEKSGLLDIAKKAIQSVIKILEKFDINKLSGKFNGVSNIFAKFKEAAQKVADIFKENWPEIQRIVKEVVDFIKGRMTTLKIIFDFLWPIIKTFGKVVLSVFRAILPVVLKVVGWIIEKLNILQNWFNKHLANGLNYLKEKWDEYWPDIQKTLAQVWEKVQPILQKIWDWLSVNVPAGLKVLSDKWNEYWPLVKEGMRIVWENFLQPTFLKLKEVMAVVIPAAITALRWSWDNVLMPTFKTISWIWSNVLNPIFTLIKNGLDIVLPGAINTLKWSWDNVLSPTFRTIGVIWNTVLSPIFNLIVDAIGTRISLAIRALKAVWDGVLMPMWYSIRSAWDNILAPAFELIKSGFFQIMDVMRMVSSFGRGVFDSVVTSVRTGISIIIDMINGAIRALNSTIISSVNNIPGLSVSFLPEIPAFASGINRVPEDMLAIIHKNEAVVPASMNPFNPNALLDGVSAVNRNDATVEVKEVNIYNNLDFNKFLSQLNYALN